jgi:hypothetical protein
MAVWSWQTDAEALVHGGTDNMSVVDHALLTAVARCKSVGPSGDARRPRAADGVVPRTGKKTPGGAGTTIPPPDTQDTQGTRGRTSRYRQ